MRIPGSWLNLMNSTGRIGIVHDDACQRHAPKQPMRRNQRVKAKGIASNHGNRLDIASEQ
ncbi:MAG: hypothetical protein HC850_05255 [Rhodomicrobium sp.]|nr:hypothetical protein [Rhodomicrobium sp.]